jgi:hypothetical protein
VSRDTWVTIHPRYERVMYGTLTHSGAAFQPTSITFDTTAPVGHDRPDRSHDPQPTTGDPLAWTGFRLLPVRSPLLGESLLLSLRPGTEMFQFPGCPPARYVFTDRCAAITRRELPHSEITGSAPVCGSPVRIVAHHVLPRHWFPEHPPYALSSLTIRPSAHGRRSEGFLTGA